MIKILIIEDEEPIRRVLVRILTDEDKTYEVEEAIQTRTTITTVVRNREKSPLEKRE